jgi:hypothetical protein
MTPVLAVAMIALAAGGFATVNRTFGVTCQQQAKHRIVRMRLEADPLFMGRATKTQDSTGCGGDGETMVGYRLPLTPRREMRQMFIRRGWSQPDHQLMTSPDGLFAAQYYTERFQDPGLQQVVTAPPIGAAKIAPRRYSVVLVFARDDL